MAMWGRLFLVGICFLAVAGCDDSSVPNLDAVVRFEIEGNKFDLPLRYMYSEAMVKRRYWPTTKAERVKVDALNISMLLPDLRPYYPEDEARWKALGHGDRVEVLIMKPVGSAGWFAGVFARSLEDVTQGQASRQPDVFGLKTFQEASSRTYFPTNGREMVLHCRNPDQAVSPSCKVKSQYLTGVVLEYYFGLAHLEKWKEIDDGLKSLCDSFSKSAE